MGYRETFFNNTKSVKGKYQCVKCKHCNRSKGADLTGTDVVQTVVAETLSGLIECNTRFQCIKLK